MTFKEFCIVQLIPKPYAVFYFITISMAALIFFCSLSGCIEDSSDELELDILELENQNEQLNNTITTLRMENENLLNQIILLNNSNNNSALQIQLLQLENHILEQNLRLQSLEHNSSLALLNDEIKNLQNLLDEEVNARYIQAKEERERAQLH